jgi:lipopolysaccharide transport system ATP-binding protein
MERYLADGGTLLLCSHSMYHIQKLCTHALWLKDGQVERYGPANDVAQAYLAYHEEKDARAHRPIGIDKAAASGWYAIEGLALEPAETLEQGAALNVRGEVFSPDDRTPVVLVGIVRADGTPVYGVATDMEDAPPLRLGAQRYAFSLTFPGIALLPGRYQVRAHALDPEGVRLFDHVEQTFTVTGATRELGFVRLPHRWQAPA